MNSPALPWSDVRVFLAVLRSGSTLRAADCLAMSQPTVARRIDALESCLGLTLFERDTRGARPTAAALRLRPMAEAMETAARDLAREAASARATTTRRIRLTLPGPNLSDGFAAIIADFTAEHPDVAFDFLPGYQMLDLAAGEADVAIRVAREITDQRLVARKLTTVAGAIFASRRYAEKHGLPASAEDLSGHRFVVFNWSGLSSLTLSNWLRERIEPSQIVSEYTDVQSLLAAIRAGIGIGPHSISAAGGDPNLVMCFPLPPETDTFTWLVFSPEAWKRPEIKAFSAFFVPRFRAHFGKTSADDRGI